MKYFQSKLTKPQVWQLKIAFYYLIFAEHFPQLEIGLKKLQSTFKTLGK